LDRFVCLLKLIGCLNLITNVLSYVLHLSLDQHKYVKPLLHEFRQPTNIILCFFGCQYVDQLIWTICSVDLCLNDIPFVAYSKIFVEFKVKDHFDGSS
jgi:hypothetical protein